MRTAGRYPNVPRLKKPLLSGGHLQPSVSISYLASLTNLARWLGIPCELRPRPHYFKKIRSAQ
jgi:hypothetical protein